MTASCSKVLIIDADTVVRESLTAFLQDADLTIFEASDGNQGLEMLRSETPDVALCDLDVPGLQGQGILKVIQDEGLATSVIIMSSMGVMSDVVEALRLGASDFLIKPILDKQVLTHAIDRCLEQGRLKRENLEYRRRLEQANLELKESLKLLEQDQQMGRQVQFRMLPESEKSFGNLQLSHRVIPSFYLSGDFIDYFLVGDKHVVFFIADVSGHGSSSAFITVLLKNLFARKRSDYLHQGDECILSPIKILERANRELLRTGTGKYATLCIGVVDLSNSSLCYGVAGHLPIPILTVNGQAQYLQGEGMPVGLFKEAEYREQTVELPEQFVITLMTDGILEVISPSGLLEQEAYLLQRLSKGVSSVDGVVDALELGDTSSIPDDIAILLVSR